MYINGQEMGRSKELTCSDQHGLGSLGGVLVDVAGQRGVVLGEVRGRQVLQHHVPVLDGVRLDNHRILAHLPALRTYNPSAF